MENRVGLVLHDLIKTYGKSIIDEPKKVEAYLRDLCAPNKKEINVVLSALREKIPHKILLSYESGNEVKPALLAESLVEDTGMADTVAGWAISTWMEAVSESKPKPQIHIKATHLKTTSKTIILDEVEAEQEELKAKRKKPVLNETQKLVKIRERRVFRSHNKSVTAVCFSPDSKLVLSGGRDGAVKVHDISSNYDVMSYPGNGEWVFDVAFSGSGKYFAYAAGSIFVFDFENRCLYQLMKFDNQVALSVAFSQDGENVIIGFKSGIVKIVNFHTKEEKRSLQGHNDSVFSIGVSADGRFFVSGGRDKGVFMRYYPNGVEYKSFLGHKDWVSRVHLSESGKLLASCGNDDKIFCYNLINGEIAAEIKGFANSVSGVTVLNNDLYVAGVGLDGYLRIFEVSTGAEVWNKKYDGRGLYSLASDVMGEYIAVGGDDGTISILELIFVPEYAMKLFNKIEEEKQKIFDNYGKKNEFESMSEYLSRISREKEKLDDVFDRKFLVEKIKLEKNIAQLISKSEKQVVLGISDIGAYDSERGSLPIIIEGDYKLVKISPLEAKIFKNNWKRAIVRGTRRLRANMQDYEYINVTIYHPELDKTFKY